MYLVNRKHCCPFHFWVKMMHFLNIIFSNFSLDCSNVYSRPLFSSYILRISLRRGPHSYDYLQQTIFHLFRALRLTGESSYMQQQKLSWLKHIVKHLEVCRPSSCLDPFFLFSVPLSWASRLLYYCDIPNGCKMAAPSPMSALQTDRWKKGLQETSSRNVCLFFGQNCVKQSLLSQG